MRIPLMMITAALVVAACGGQQAEQPAPQPAPPPVDSTAIKERMRQDSIAAAERARAEAEARARAEAEARAAAERARAALRAELALMINFEFDKSAVMPGDMANLDRKAAILNANAGLRIRVAGHADERGSDEYNFALGNRRAEAAKRYLANKGIAGTRIEVVSFGEERPVDPASTEAAWAKNRRAEFEILAGGDALVAPR